LVRKIASAVSGRRACLILGIGRPYAAAALIAFTIAASVTMLDFWRYSGVERLSLRSAFITNIAIVGGLLVAGTTGGE
jgi:putative oxidoreductase